MARVWKYELPVEDDFTLDMPAGAEFLYVDTQHGKPMLWARVEEDRGSVERRFRTYGTGHYVSGVLDYVGSYMLAEGRFVGHVFEALVRD